MQTKKQLRKQLAETRRERDELKQIVKLCRAYIDAYRADMLTISYEIGKLNHFCKLCEKIIAADRRDEDYYGTCRD